MAKSKTKLQSVPITPVSKPMGWIERGISGSTYSAIISDCRQVPKVLSSMTTLSKMCCPGFDWNLQPIEEGNDTMTSQIDEALIQIRKIDKKVGRIGKSKRVGTLGIVRQTLTDTLSFRQSVWEFAMGSESQWNFPSEIQCIPSTSLFRNPLTTNRMDTNKIPDKLLPGIIFDLQDDEIHFYQSKTLYDVPIELNSDQIVYIEDLGVPEDTSFLASLVPSIEQWKAMRKNLMVALHRGYAAPNEVAQINIDQLARAKEAGISINIDDLITYATAMVQNQGIETAKLSMPGMALEYPSIPLSTDPTIPDKYLIGEIISHFFQRDITEQLAQAVSASAQPALAVINSLVASYREVNGKPWENFWYDNFLEPNGFGDLELTFDWWDWTPIDKLNDANIQTQRFRSGSLLINEYRQKFGDSALTDEELQQLYAEQMALKTPKMQQQFGGGGMPQQPQMQQSQSSPSEGFTPEELELIKNLPELSEETEEGQEQEEVVKQLQEAAKEETLSKEEKRLLELLRQKGKIAEKAVNHYFKD